MICIRLVVSHDDSDADDVATVVEITSSMAVVTGVELVVLSFAVIIHQVIAVASEVAFSELNSLNDVILFVVSTHARTKVGSNGPTNLQRTWNWVENVSCADKTQTNKHTILNYKQA